MIATVLLYIMASIGCLVATAAGVWLFIASMESLRDWRREPHQWSFLEGQQHARNRLANDSWWFSESPETCELLRDLSRGVDVSTAREKWRKAQEAKAMESVK
jgi:hypothetical protein